MRVPSPEPQAAVADGRSRALRRGAPFAARSGAAAGRRAFTLVEALVSLTLLMGCLLAGLAVHAQQRRVLDRLAAQEEALRALEGTFEALRAGALPVVSGPVVVPPGLHAGGLAVELRVAPAGVADLYDVHAEASYTLAGEARRRSLDSLVWVPAP